MIYVLGSINVDLVVYSNRFPEIGETITGNGFLLNQGGKGANQAIAAKQAGAETTFIGRIGDDYFGEIVLKNLHNAGVITKVKKDKNTATGTAIINVDSKGKNKIVIVRGANGKIKDSELFFLQSRIKSDDTLMIQGEIDSTVLFDAAVIANKKKATVILDPAPSSKQLLPVSGLSTFVTPNELELEGLVDKSGKIGINALLELGAQGVIVKMGEKGVVYKGTGKQFSLPAFNVNAVDSTGAGDMFNGAFAAALSENKSLKESIIFAEAAAAISVTRKGAAVSFPMRNEINEFLNKNKQLYTR